MPLLRRAPLLTALISLVALSGTRPVSPSPPGPTGGVEEAIPMMMNAYGVDGLSVVVVRGQETVLARGFGVQADGTPFTADTPVGAYSATKALSSFVYASLVEDGRIDLDARLGGLLDDAPDAWAEIPFWRLLNHTSGIPMIVNRPEFEALAANPTSSNADVYEIVRQLPLDYAPGEASRYRQSGYAIAEMILEDRLGATWLELVAEHLTSPAGAAATAHAHVASGARTTPLLASAGWYETTADDMAAIFKALNAGAVVDPAFLEDVLFQDRYDFDGYSLGSILETIDGVRTVGHQGGGARATIRYVPSRGVGVAVFTDDRENNDLAIHLAELFVREAALGQEPERPVAVALFSMRSAPAEDVVAFYQAESRRSGAPFDFARGEWALNRLGYMLLQEGRMDDAVTVFELNAREHPQSANVHDSLGEGYLERGDLDAALRSYRRVLELAPRSRNAPRMIEQIEAMRDGEP